MGNTAEGKYLHTLISNEKTREQVHRLRRLNPRQRGAGVSELTIKDSLHTLQGLQLTSREITQK